MKTLQTKKEDILASYKKADAKERLLLEKLFGKETFSEPSSNYMELWDDFCKKNKLKVTLPHEKPKDSDEESDNAYVMLRNIIKVVNQGWTPDWNDSNQSKYYPYFSMRSGFGFGNSYYEAWGSDTACGSRLCFKSRELAEKTAKEFLPIYKKFFTKEGE